MSDFLGYPYIAELESLRESGDYTRLAAGIRANWEAASPFLEESVRIRLLVADIHKREGRIPDVETALTPYLDGLKHVPFSVAANTLVACSGFYDLRGEFKLALHAARTANRIAAARGDSNVATEALEAEGLMHCRLDDWVQAVACLEEASSQYSDQDRIYRLGLVHRALGEARMHIGDIEPARAELDRAIRLLAKSRDEIALAEARTSMAVLMNLTGSFDVSRKYLQLATDVYERLGCPANLMKSLFRTAETLILMKDYEKAEPYINRLLDLAALSNNGEMTSVKELQGRLHLAHGRFAEAETLLTAALVEARSRRDRHREALALRSLGRVYMAQKRDIEATTLLRNARQIAEEIQHRILELETCLLLAEAACSSAPVEAYHTVAGLEAEIEGLPLPELKEQCKLTRDYIRSQVGDHYFVLSDATLPTLQEGRSALLKWLWDRSLDNAKGNAAVAAELLNVTPTYIRQLTKRNTRTQTRSTREFDSDSGATKVRRASS